MHTPLCHHATGEPVEYARRARELGLSEIGFTDIAALDAAVLDAHLKDHRGGRVESLDEVLVADAWAREAAMRWLSAHAEAADPKNPPVAV